MRGRSQSNWALFVLNRYDALAKSLGRPIWTIFAILGCFSALSARYEATQDWQIYRRFLFRNFWLFTSRRRLPWRVSTFQPNLFDSLVRSWWDYRAQRYDRTSSHLDRELNLASVLQWAIFVMRDDWVLITVIVAVAGRHHLLPLELAIGHSGNFVGVNWEVMTATCFFGDRAESHICYTRLLPPGCTVRVIHDLIRYDLILSVVLL